MANVKQLIEENDFNFKKKFGQNFLIDPNIINKIVASADILADSLVIEIGVGSGNLTKKIAEVAKNVIGYEIDNDLKPILASTLDKYKNVEIIYDDFLKRDIKVDLSKYDYKHIYVVANLPYYITTPIITKLIGDKIDLKKMIVMVQKEVADRINARPNSKEYNSLTIFLNYYFKISKLFDVSRNVFVPRPNVDSSIIELESLQDKHNIKNEKLFFEIVRAAFTHKRKNLRNNLNNYDLTKIETVLKKYGLDLTVRAEQLTIEQFIDISDNL